MSVNGQESTSQIFPRKTAESWLVGSVFLARSARRAASERVRSSGSPHAAVASVFRRPGHIGTAGPRFGGRRRAGAAGGRGPARGCVAGFLGGAAHPPTSTVRRVAGRSAPGSHQPRLLGGRGPTPERLGAARTGDRFGSVAS